MRKLALAIMLSATAGAHPTYAASSRIEPAKTSSPAHGGIFTGHWEFDVAIVLFFLMVMTYSFLLPVDAPRGLARRLVQALVVAFGGSGIFFAILGFRSIVG